ncbi:hypothetical protein [Staphylococcus haemolyticus]|uniref:hypothetical protein n=1 Tax=Staphylococcus haemolyticus TaxID=1283 RepID=UPI002DBD73CA|nr:hypothetical protein [Staphylococcus haemolyticus]MEB7348382.1 hypothetical protein [Staphylococcus haemolyticus]
MVKIKKRVALGPKAFLMQLLKKEETEVELDGYTFNYNEENYLFGPEIIANEVISYDPHSGTFTVEVEEEITEETKLPKFLEISFDRKSGRDFAVVREKESIKNIVDKNIEHFIDTRTIHLFDDDETHTLIWKYGELVGDEQCLN